MWTYVGLVSVGLRLPRRSRPRSEVACDRLERLWRSPSPVINETPLLPTSDVGDVDASVESETGDGIDMDDPNFWAKM